MNQIPEGLTASQKDQQLRTRLNATEASIEELNGERTALLEELGRVKVGYYSRIESLTDTLRLEGLGLSVGDPDKSVSNLLKQARRLIAYAEGNALRSEYVQADRSELAWGQLTDEACRPPGEPLPERFGLKGITQYIGKPNIIGGFAGLGKTTVLINILYEYMLQGKPVIFFSHEWTPGRVLAACLNMFFAQSEGGSMNISEIFSMLRDERHPRRPDYEAFKARMNDLKQTLVIDAKGWSVKDITGLYELYRQEHGEEPHVLIDYFQKINPDDDLEREDARMRFKTTMNRITDFADTTNAAWTLAAQENRSGHKENRKTTDGNTLYGAGDHSNFQETSAIEQDAALCMSIGREQDLNNEWLPDLVLRVNKNRFGRLKQSKVEIDLKSGLILRAKA